MQMSKTLGRGSAACGLGSSGRGDLPGRHQVGDQVADLVGVEDVELAVGHERELATCGSPRRRRD